MLFRSPKEELIDALHDALYASKVCAYAQGFSLLKAASEQYQWRLNFGDLALLWRGGCIIRARFLDRIHAAYSRQADLPNLMLDPFFLEALVAAQSRWRKVLVVARQCGIPTPAMNACLDYYDAYRQAVLPARVHACRRRLEGIEEVGVSEQRRQDGCRDEHAQTEQVLTQETGELAPAEAVRLGRGEENLT